tara:strand:+ start:90 stop:497 length:408 start_codon:yes stop_codon:yes gene_type:complete
MVKTNIKNDKLLSHCWDDKVVSESKSYMDLGKTFREKEYEVVMWLMKKKVMELEKGRQSQGLKKLTEYFRDLEWKFNMDMICHENLEKGEIYYEEKDGYSTSKVDETLTESKIMEVIYRDELWKKCHKVKDREVK